MASCIPLGLCQGERNMTRKSSTSLSLTSPIRLAPEKVKDLKDLLIYIHPHEKANYFRDIIDKQERVPLSDPDSDSDDDGEV